MDATIASFNLNNLFSHFNWSGTVDPAEQGVTYLRRAADGTTTELGDVAFVVRRDASDRRRMFMGKLVNEKDPAMTARVAARIIELDAEVLLVQEVEDQTALEDFNRTSLNDMYDQIVVLEGNDLRLIDVGIMVRRPLGLGAVTTWKHARHPNRSGDPVFSRDLLQAELLAASGGRVLTVYNTHLKSHFIDAFNREEGRPKTEAEVEAERVAANLLRRQQAEVAAEIIASRFDEPVLLGGDMNDPPASEAFDADRVVVGAVARPAASAMDPGGAEWRSEGWAGPEMVEQFVSGRVRERMPDRQIHPASATRTSTRGTPPRSRTAPERPRCSQGRWDAAPHEARNQPGRNEPDTHQAPRPAASAAGD